MYTSGNSRDLFPTTIYEAIWPDFENVRQSLIDKVMPYFETNLAQGNDYVDSNGKDIFKRTVPNLHLYPEFKEVIEFIEYHGQEYWKIMGWTTQEKPYVLQIWANDVPPGGFTPTHNHNPVAVGGVLYLDADPLKGNIHLEDPMQMVKGRMPYDWQKKPYLYTEEIKVEAGKLIMFPGWLMHHVRSNKSDSNRIVIGYNFGLTWIYKPRPYSL
jgi:uncharacterized protein (TIGR02466 family)